LLLIAKAALRFHSGFLKHVFDVCIATIDCDREFTKHFAFSTANWPRFYPFWAGKNSQPY